jgi:membrane protein DedA with SNARE-associated domain
MTDWKAIFASIFTAPKISVMTIVALIVTGIIYLFSEKLGIIKNEDRIFILLMMFSVVLFLIFALILIYSFVSLGRKQEHERAMKKQSKKRRKSK